MLANIFFFSGVIFILNGIYLFNFSVKETRKGYMKNEEKIRKSDKQAFVSIAIGIILFFITSLF
ncbi:hypothetical protein SAMN02745164_00539 [Marinitoga hydrogenitolerans DSM 16785]|uniref:Mid2-like cell wall stress sensor domain protein n=1 Tax=Marinitoga hydrogenitolerans (strain DSM 16785 / JCM 12826 / AT1271) TaxID=1122195 RepID=A0A1M4TX12_MARH1|nr:hypothetical protein [Marinitoga hydrogenitolerans]SHE49009.1 hypothetical protein SAMN02745164_00539 [Marinitoga hydrogenitolerans DSM 16785]